MREIHSAAVPETQAFDFRHSDGKFFFRPLVPRLVVSPTGIHFGSLQPTISFLRRESMRRFTKSIRMVAGLLTGLLFATSAVPLGAQPARQSHPFYDISKEVTLRGTVSDVLAKAAPG